MVMVFHYRLMMVMTQHRISYSSSSRGVHWWHCRRVLWEPGTPMRGEVLGPRTMDLSCYHERMCIIPGCLLNVGKGGLRTVFCQNSDPPIDLAGIMMSMGDGHSHRSPPSSIGGCL